MNILLISTYELGRQPFGLASPAAWLRAGGARVSCLDLSREELREEAVRGAEMIAFYVPMHTATRLAVALLPAVREMNPGAHICFYGLYAPVNEGYLRRLGVGTILGGEFEEGLEAVARRLQGLKPQLALRVDGGVETPPFQEEEWVAKGARTEPVVSLAKPPRELPSQETTGTRKARKPNQTDARMSELKLRPPKEALEIPELKLRPPGEANFSAGGTSEQMEPVISLARQKFLVPDRRGFVGLENYARLVMPDSRMRTVGYTEASRGCKHLCRHCPIVPVYRGAFRVVERDVVMEDIRRQVAAGAEHITFGDPDFFNGVGHAMPLVEELHGEFPRLSYDVTIKVEHLLKHRDCLGRLRETGCLFVTSAVESVDDAVLGKLEKHHTRADFLEAVGILREVGLDLQATFVPFTPWTTISGYCELLELLRSNGLIENVAPIQLAIRLLIPAGSLLMELAEIRGMVGAFDEAGLVYPWKHADAGVDRLCEELQGIVHAGEQRKLGRARIFERIEEAAYAAAGGSGAERVARDALPVLAARAAIPYLNEPWYC